MPRADYSARPFAALVIFKRDGQWWVRMAGQEAGPCTKARCVRAAIRTARAYERRGMAAVVTVLEGGEIVKVWPKPTKRR